MLRRFPFVVSYFVQFPDLVCTKGNVGYWNSSMCRRCEEYQARSTFQLLAVEVGHEVARPMLYTTSINIKCVYCAVRSTMSDSIRSLSSVETACKNCVETRVQKHHIYSRSGTGRHQIRTCPQVQCAPVHSNFGCITFPEDLKQSSRFAGTHTQNQRPCGM